MSILKLLFALNPKNLKLMKAEKMTPDMANQIDSFLGKIGAVVNIGKYKLTPKQAKFWVDQKKELDIYNKKLNEMIQSNKKTRTKKESVMVYDKDHKPGMAGMEVEIPASKKGIGSLDESKNVIDFPIKPKPPEGEPFAVGGRAGYSIGGLIRLLNSLKKGKKIKNLAEQEEIFRKGPITSEFLENVDKKFLEPFIRTRDKYGPEGYGLYKNFDEMPAGLQAAELIKRVKTKGGGIDYESAEAFIGKKLKGDETIDELINMVVQPQKIKKATGGRVGFKKGGNYWLIVQEAYDAAGGEEQTGLSLFDFANKYFPKMADGGRVGLMAGGILKGGKKILDLTKKAKKAKAKKDVKRQMTDEEIKDFADEYGINPTDEYYTFDGTLADAKRILKESEDYKEYMYQQYKKGKLDPVSGEQSPARMKLLRQKLEEAGATKDKRLINDDELEELYELEKQYLKSNEESSFPKKGMFDDVFDKMFSEYEYDQYIKSGRKPNADGGAIGMNVSGYEKGGSVKKSLSEKIIGFLGGKDATAAELGLLGMEQLYNLLGLPFYANGGAVGMPPISTSNPKEAGKIILDSILGSSVENIPIYQGDNLGITAGFGIGSQRPIDYGVGFNYGNFQGGFQMNQGEPSFGIGYRKEFEKGGLTDTIPPKKGPMSQGVESLFRKR